MDAPVAAGQALGTLSVYSGEELIETLPLLAEREVARQNVWQRFLALLGAAVSSQPHFRQKGIEKAPSAG